MRAFLIVEPGSADTFDAGLASGADVLVVDLAEFGLEPWLALGDALRDRPRGSGLAVRVGSVDAPAIDAQLRAAMAWRPHAIMLPVDHGRDVAHLGARLAVHEAENGTSHEATRIVALVASAAGALHVASLCGASPRLVGIGWDAVALAAELRAPGLDETGGWSTPLAGIRCLVRLAAAASRVEAVETACPGDGRGFSDHLAAARRDGFGGLFAIGPAQVARIREA